MWRAAKQSRHTGTAFKSNIEKDLEELTRVYAAFKETIIKVFLSFILWMYNLLNQQISHLVLEYCLRRRSVGATFTFVFFTKLHRQRTHAGAPRTTPRTGEPLQKKIQGNSRQRAQREPCVGQGKKPDVLTLGSPSLTRTLLPWAVATISVMVQ